MRTLTDLLLRSAEAFMAGLAAWACLYHVLWPAQSYLLFSTGQLAETFPHVAWAGYVGLVFLYPVFCGVTFVAWYWIAVAIHHRSLRQHWLAASGLVASCIISIGVGYLVLGLLVAMTDAGSSAPLSLQISNLSFWITGGTTVFSVIYLACLLALAWRRKTASGGSVEPEVSHRQPGRTLSGGRVAFFTGMGLGLAAFPWLFGTWSRAIAPLLPLPDADPFNMGLLAQAAHLPRSVILCLFLCGLVLAGLHWTVSLVARLRGRAGRKPDAIQTVKAFRMRELAMAIAIFVTAAVLWAAMTSPHADNPAVTEAATRQQMRELVDFIASRKTLLRHNLPGGDIRQLYEWLRLFPESERRVAGLLADDSAGTLRDCWGRELVYRCPSERYPGLFELYSTGPNGTDEGGQEDDISFNDVMRMWSGKLTN